FSDVGGLQRVLLEMRLRTRLLRHAALAGLVAALCACDSGRSGGPRASVRAGTYALTSVDGHPPAVPTDSTAQEWGQIRADTLVFSSDSRVERHIVFRRVNTVLGSDVVYRPNLELEYRLEGERLEIGSFSPCSIAAICLPNDVGIYFPGDGAISLTTHW